MPNPVDPCAGCGETVPSYDIVHYGSFDSGYRLLCTRCFNDEVAKRCGVDGFENIRLEPIGITDCSGETHQFHFQTRLLGGIVSLEAFELRDGSPGGYECQIIGDPEDDLFTLLGRLVQKIRRMLSIKHITEDERHGLQIADQTVRGRIDGDYSGTERTPVVIVDGREISWAAFGEMLLTFEGWQFKLDIVDNSDEP
jgi:hypothetical protein